eukprot:PhF_6_TR11673/c0_g1_i1/m.18889
MPKSTHFLCLSQYSQVFGPTENSRYCYWRGSFLQRTSPSHGARNFYDFLDAFGKWSLIDAYVMVMMMVAFRFHVVVDVDPGSTLDVFVTPRWGFYSFLLATIISLIISHVEMHYHRVAGHIFEEIAKDALSIRSLADRSQWKGVYRWGVVFTLTACCIFVVIGSIIHSFQFEFHGAAEVVFSYLNESTHQPYSVLSLGTAIPYASHDYSNPGIYFIQVTFFLFSCVVPVVHLVLMIVLWITPMRQAAQQKLYLACEVLLAWSAVDVFVIAIIAALLEIEQFVGFIIGDNCDAINQVLKEYMSDVFPDSRCFDVKATLLGGCWMLFGAMIVYGVVAAVVMRLCHTFLEHRHQNHNSGKEGHLNTNGSEVEIQNACIQHSEDDSSMTFQPSKKKKFEIVMKYEIATVDCEGPESLGSLNSAANQ